MTIKMDDRASDPYSTLGVAPTVTDAELRSAYRRLVQRHHPDHNGGSPESARRFELIQEAYARVLSMRRGAPPPGAATAAGESPGDPERARGPEPAVDPEPPVQDLIQQRIRELERELERQRLAAEEAAREAARRAAATGATPPRRATPEELGYITTDDSISKILDDAGEELSERVRRADLKRKFARRLTDLFGADE